MAGGQNSNAADTLSADLKALQDRVDRLTGRLDQTQQQLDQAQQKLTLQESRTNDVIARVGDVGGFLTGFSVVIAIVGILVTVLMVVIGIVSYFQAGAKAKAEAEDWFDKNSEKLRAEIAKLEGEASACMTRMQEHAKKVEDDAANHTVVMGRAAEDVQGRLAAILAGTIDQSKTFSAAEQGQLQQADFNAKGKPVRDYTAQDWNILAWAAYNNDNKDDAVFYWGKVVESPKATSDVISIALYNKGVALGKLGRSDEAISVYDEVVKRFGDAEEIVLREQVAISLFNKGVRLGKLGRSEEEVVAYDEVVKRFKGANEVVLRKQVSRAYANLGWLRYLAVDDQGLLRETERALERFPRNGAGLCNRAFALHLVGRPWDEVMDAYRHAWSVIQSGGQWEELALADLRNHGRTVRPDDERVPDDLIAEVAALAVNKE